MAAPQSPGIEPVAADLPLPPLADGIATLAHLLGDPYRYVSRQARSIGTDVFRIRFPLEPVVCLTGARAGACFYDERRFRRDGAAPEPLRATLFGEGGVQSLDGERHAVRKALFLELTTAERVQALALRFRAALTEVMDRRDDSPVSLFELVQPAIAQAVCDWSGVPLAADERAGRTRDLVALFDQAAAKGFGHLQARRARHRADRWAAGLILDAREARGGSDDLGSPSAPSVAAASHETGRPALERDALGTIAAWKDASGELLAPQVAGVELLNLLRPTVAVSVFVTFAAHALHGHPSWHASLADALAKLDANDDPPALHAFVQEVRRHYPFFPLIAARARSDVECLDHRIPAGCLTLFDVYGTNHDARSWSRPDDFDPGRFTPQTHDGVVEPWSDTRFAFVPQGGGDVAAGHRCPGEGIALALMKAAVRVLTVDARYRVPEQDLGLDMARLPALPRDRMMIVRDGLRPG